MKRTLAATLAIISFTINFAVSQSISLPPSGNNQRSSITQWIGLASVTITYNSPDVKGPNGEDRKGMIWGGVVPYGMVENNFGTAKEIPWRAGANENTTISFSHDVTVEGHDIKAGTYGIHMIPGKEKWTLIFSNDSDAWGSYFYNEEHDALRVEVGTLACNYTEWLSYRFIEKKPSYTVAVLQWEELMVPFKIEADVNRLYVEQIRSELKGASGLDRRNWIAAVDFCLDNDVNLEEALLWSEYAIHAPFVGEVNFNTLTTKLSVLYKLGRDNSADELLIDAIKLKSASMTSIAAFGHSLIERGLPKEALHVFKLNSKKYPEDNFTTILGLAEGYQAVGKMKQAVKYFREAAENAAEGRRDYYLALASRLDKK